MKPHPDSSTDWETSPARNTGRGERSLGKSYAPERERRLVDLERFRALLDQSDDLIFLVQISSSRIVDVNGLACRQLGYSREALLAMSLANLVPEPVWAQLVALFADEGQVDQGGRIIATTFRGENGETPVEMSVRLVSLGDAVYAVIVARDITGRQQVEAVLQGSETRFRSVVESSPMGMHMYHLESDGRLVFVGANPAADRILGVDNSQFVGKTIEEAFPPLAATEVPERYRRAAAQGESWVTEQIDYVDAKIAGAFEVHAFQTEPGRMVAMFLDITERKQAEVELRQLKEFNESIVQNMAEGITVQDVQGCFTFVNPAAANLLGYTVEELTGQHWTHIIPPDQQPIVRAADQRRMQGKTDRYELELVRQGGGRFPVLVSGSPRFDADTGDFVGTLAVFADIGERVRTEEALHRRTEQLEALHQVGLEIATQLDLDALLHSIASRAVELVGGTIGGFYLYQPDREVLKVVTAIGVDPAVVGITLRRGEGLAGKILQSGQALVVEDYLRWEGRAAVFDEIDFRATVGVPVRWGDEFLGVLDVSSNLPGQFFASDAELLSMFATQAAIAIQNARLFQETQQQLGELALLFETSAAVSTSLDLDTVLDAIARQITSSLGVESCAISAWDREQDILVTLLDHGPDLDWWELEAPGTIYRLEDYPASCRVLTERQPLAVLISDPNADPIEVAWMKSEGLKSLLMVPLVVRGEAVGYLELMESREERAFTTTEITLCQTLANHAAAALESARLFQAEREQRELAEAMREAAQAMGASLDLHEILRLILEQLKRVLAYDTASVVIFREGHVPDLLVGLGYADERITSREAGKLFQDSPILRQMARDLQPVVSPDVRHLEGWIWVRGSQQVRSWLGIPLVARERMIGVLMADHAQPGVFGPEELQIVQALAQHAAQAVENAQLYAEARRRNQELALLNRVIAASAASQEINTTLELVCRELALIFDLPQAAAGLLSEDRTQVIVVAEYQRDEGPPLQPRIIPVDAIPAFKHLLEQKVPLVVDEALTSPQLEPIRDLVQNREVVSLLFLPLIVKGEVLGGLVLGATEQRPFPVEQVSLAQRVAEQVSGSLARARLERERRRLEEQFRQRQKMEALGRLAGGVAHDFNNLLTVIHISTQLLQRQLHPQDPLTKHVREIQETGERAASLTRQLLSFSRREVISPRLLNLNQVVGDLSRMLQRVLGEDVHLNTLLVDDLWTVEADPSQIDQVILNLAVNARDAMPGGGTLILETANVILDEAYAARHVEAQPGEYVRLSVSDNGTGMDDRVKARVFEPFFTTKERGQGSGLGLATVFGIVKQNAGHIEVHSQVGQGTTFKIYLPRTPEPTLKDRQAADDLEPEMPSLERGRRGMETILLVEDDAPIKDLAMRVLESYGYRVLAAGDGLQALQVVERYDGPIHLLLTDVVLPQMSGKELAEQLQSVRPDMGVLYMSGYTDGAITRHGELAPGIAFVSKPFTIEELTQKVWEVLANI